MKSFSCHNPPHLHSDNMYYMITASTIDRQRYLHAAASKQKLRSAIFDSTKELQCDLFAWIIMENHYHILIKIRRSRILGKLLNSINGRSSYYINGLDKQRGRKIWYSYWDTCIRNENDFFTRFNYIHNNPIKHGFINEFDTLRSYDFSSYIYYLKTKGQEWLTDMFMSYPIADYIEKYDDY